MGLPHQTQLHPETTMNPSTCLSLNRRGPFRFRPSRCAPPTSVSPARELRGLEKTHNGSLMSYADLFITGRPCCGYYAYFGSQSHYVDRQLCHQEIAQHLTRSGRWINISHPNPNSWIPAPAQ